MWRPNLALPACLVIAACSTLTDPSEHSIGLQTDGVAYQIGALGHVTVTNHHARPIDLAHAGPGTCGLLSSEIRRGTEWDHLGFLGPCWLVRGTTRLGAGESIVVEFSVDKESGVAILGPGTYRLAVPFRAAGGGTYLWAWSNEFVVAE